MKLSRLLPWRFCRRSSFWPSESLTRVCRVVRVLQNSCVYRSPNSCFQELKCFGACTRGRCVQTRHTCIPTAFFSVTRCRHQHAACQPDFCRAAVQGVRHIPPTPGPLLQGRHLSELPTSLSFLVYTSLWLTCPARLGGRAPTQSLFGKGSQGTEAAEKAQGRGRELPGPGPLRLDLAPAPLSSKPIFVKLHLHL